MIDKSKFFVLFKIQFSKNSGIDSCMYCAVKNTGYCDEKNCCIKSKLAFFSDEKL